jgi:pimeloyl-ACP methyl ester carboxylesterase
MDGFDERRVLAQNALQLDAVAQFGEPPMRIVIGIIGSALGLSVVLVLLGLVSARFSLDHEYEHTRHTESLPLFVRGVSDGLVRIPAREMMFRARVAGLQQDGPAVIMLHGFPETSMMWEPLIEKAVAAGFRIVAFDQRGYSPGARPDGVEPYALSEVVADLFAVASVVGMDRFHLVAHDWGSIAGWLATAENPDRVLSYASLSIPHPSAIAAANAAESVPAYVRFFQRSGLAETLLFAVDSRLLRGIYSEMPTDLLTEYMAVFSEPGAMRAALNWYRARWEFVFGDPFVGEVVQPVLFVTGSQDLPFIVRPEIRAQHPNFVTGPFKVVDVDAGHWLMQEETEEVVEVVMTHLLAQANSFAAINEAAE